MPTQAQALVTKLQGELADVAKRAAGQPKVTVFEALGGRGQYYPAAGTRLDALNR